MSGLWNSSPRKFEFREETKGNHPVPKLLGWVVIQIGIRPELPSTSFDVLPAILSRRYVEPLLPPYLAYRLSLVKISRRLSWEVVICNHTLPIASV